MTIWEALIMALIQGLTEFLPVSSSGHLAIFKNIFNVNLETGLLYDVLLHFGTLIAITIVYWKDIKELFVNGIAIVWLWIVNTFIWIGNLFSKEKKAYKKVIINSYRRFVILIIISTFITGVLGLVFEKLIGNAGETLLIPGICLLITGLVLLLADRCKGGNKTEKDTPYKDSAIVGVVQGIATLPGLSRSGSTIAACLICGFEKEYAVKYSFIMSIPAVLGATILELKDFNTIDVSKTEVLYYIIGMIVAAVIGYICIKTMLVIVKKFKFWGFSIYCFIMGTLSIICYFVM